MMNEQAATNDFIGGYQSILINNGSNIPVLCTSFSDNNNMSANQTKIFDGKPISNLFSANKIDNTYHLNCPVIIGKTNEPFYDGLNFFFYSMNNFFSNPSSSLAPNYKLPLIKSVSLSTSETSTSMSFDLISDGIRKIDSTYNRQLYMDRINYNIVDFDLSTLREAYNQDFIIGFGPYRFLVNSFNYAINYDVRSFTPMRQTNVPLSTFNDANDGNVMYSFLVPGKATVTCSGVATAQKEQFGFTNYNYTGYDNLSMQSAGINNFYKQYIWKFGNQFELFLQHGNFGIPIFKRNTGAGLQIDSGYFTSLNVSTTLDNIQISFNLVLNSSIVYNSN